MLHVAGRTLLKFNSTTSDSILQHDDLGGNVLFKLGRGTTVSGNDLLLRSYNGIAFAPNNTDNPAVYFSSAGNVGIGTTTPSATLEVSGSIKFGGRKISQVTECRKSGVAPQYTGSSCGYKWVIADCDNGLPSGQCLGFATRLQHSGNDEDWRVMKPAEVGTVMTYTNGGLEWWNGTNCAYADINIAAVYMCQ